MEQSHKETRSRGNNYLTERLQFIYGSQGVSDQGLAQMGGWNWNWEESIYKGWALLTKNWMQTLRVTSFDVNKLNRQWVLQGAAADQCVGQFKKL